MSAGAFIEEPKEMIQVENVTKEYHNSDTGHVVRAVESVNFHVSANEFVCLLGPSGCGKSTILNLIAGFLHLTSGRIMFAGQEVNGPGLDRCIVFQDPTLFPWLNARQNIEFGLVNKGLSRKERQQKTAEVLRLVGLEGFGHARPHELSGGQRQRIALARVLVVEPKVFLMDEPFSALDANTRERLQDEILRIRESHRQPVLFVTHNADEAAYLADRVIVMGPPPGSVRAELTMPLLHPRDRSSDELRRAATALRSELRKLPCCIPTEGKDSLDETDRKVSCC